MQQGSLNDHPQRAVKIVLASREEVIGRLSAGAEENGVFGMPAMLGLAETLGDQLVELLGPDYESFTPLESKILVLARSAAHELLGRTAPVHTAPEMVILQTSIYGEDSERLAIVTHVRQRSTATARSRPAAGAELPSRSGEGIERHAEREPAEETDIPALRRRQIFEAGTEVISRVGFARATMREIARVADMPIPTMYQYVKSKDDILEFIFDFYLREMAANLSAAVERAQTGEEKIRAAVTTSLENLDRYHQQIKLMTADAKLLRPEVLRRVIERLLRYLQLYSKAIQSAIESGEVRHVNAELYGNLIAMMCQVWPMRYWSVGKFGLPAVREAILDLTFNGLLAGSVKRD